MKNNSKGKVDYLASTAGNDSMRGGAGKDVLDGGAGDDTLEGGRGLDVFVLQQGGGDDVVLDFNRLEGDRVHFEIGSGISNGVLPPLGRLYDGQVFTNYSGDAKFTVSAVDANGDGVTDTKITAEGPGGTVDSITLLGVSPDSLSSGDIYGG